MGTYKGKKERKRDAPVDVSENMVGRGTELLAVRSAPQVQTKTKKRPIPAAG